MSVATVAARAYYETVDSADADVVASLFAANAIYRRPGYEPLVGRAAILRFYESVRVIESGRHTISDIVSDGFDVAVRGTFAGKLSDGSSVEIGFADFFVFDQELRIFARSTYFEAPAV